MSSNSKGAGKTNGSARTDHHDGVALVDQSAHPPPAIVIESPSTGVEPSPIGDGDPEAIDEATAQKRASVKLDDFICLGRYTVVVCLFAELMILCQLGNMLYMMYAGAAPNLAGCGSLIFTEQQDPKERCALAKQLGGGNQSMPSCVPKLDSQFDSVNLEFGYFCEGTRLVKQSISAQMVGVMVGSALFGYLSDSYGRRRMMLVALVLCIGCMVITSYTSGLFWFTFWRFWVNVFNGGTIVILMVFNVENLPKKDRFWISNLITWSPNIVLFAIIAYFAGDWRTLTRVSAALALPAVGLLFFLCESPRFLVQSRRINEARAAIHRIYRFDKRHLDISLLDHVLNREERLFEESKKKKNCNYIHLFYTWTLMRYTIAVATSFLVTSIMNYSLMFNMEKLSGSIYWNSIFMGLFRYSCNLVIAFMDIRFKWLGRKTVHFIADSFAATALGVYIIIYTLGLEVTLADLVRVAVLSVIGICSLLYTTNGVASNELFPTPIRNISYSFGQLFTRVGVVLSPQLFFLADWWTPLPFIAMFVLAIVDLLLFQFNVIETKGRPLTEHMPGPEECLFNRGEKHKSVELLPMQNQQKGQNAPEQQGPDGVVAK